MEAITGFHWGKAHDDRFRRISVPVDAIGVLVLGPLATRSLNFWLRYCL